MRFGSLFMAAVVLAAATVTVHAQNNLANRPAARRPGAVNFQLGGGAGMNPNFIIRDGSFSPRGSLAAGRLGFGAYNTPVAVGYGGNNWGGFFGQGGFTNLYNQGFIPVPPYFSLHPPVYYSAPVPRTYGYSPFPYPGDFATPEVYIAEPQVIENPYVKPEEVPAPAQETSNRTAAAPLMIRNPFVEGAADASLAHAQNSSRSE